jgi:hypothetical protein
MTRTLRELENALDGQKPKDMEKKLDRKLKD